MKLKILSSSKDNLKRLSLVVDIPHYLDYTYSLQIPDSEPHFDWDILEHKRVGKVFDRFKQHRIKECPHCLGPLNVLFMPCGHGACILCQRPLRECPACGEYIVDKMRVSSG